MYRRVLQNQRALLQRYLIRAEDERAGFGELVCKFARKALVPFHEPHKGIDRSDPRASVLFQLERNTRRGAAADSIHNPARTTNILMGERPLAKLASVSHACVLQSLSDTRAEIRYSRISQYPRIRKRRARERINY